MCNGINMIHILSLKNNLCNSNSCEECSTVPIKNQFKFLSVINLLIISILLALFIFYKIYTNYVKINNY